MADRGRRAIDERHFRADDDRLAALADHQHEIADQRAADLDVSASMTSVRNPDASARDGVRPGRNRRDVVVPFGIGEDRHGETSRVVAHADQSATDYGA